MRLDESALGVRMTVRRRLPGESGPSGGPAMTDVVGRVVEVADATATVELRDGSLVDVPLADVVSARRVPDGRRRARTRPAGDFTPAEVSRVCTRGWPPTEAEPLGDWLLRAAGGFTGRANSVAVHGDPGLDLPDALAAVSAFYADRGLRPRAQVFEETSWEEAFERSGWRGGGGTHDHAVVQVADLRDAVPPAVADAEDEDVSVARSVDETWLAMYTRASGTAAATARAVLEGPPTVGFVRLGDPVVGIGRVAVTGEWAGMSCVEVAPERRREGVGRRIVDASLRWAVRHGADKAYLQTMRDNGAALGLYARYGFREHHTYRYLTPGTV